MPRPGFVLEVDRSTPPTLFWNGEGLSLEKLPADRSRVIYPPEPLAPIDDIDGAIRDALLHPIDQDPLPALLFPGMRLTIAFDDISLPLPPMRRPDIRQRVIEAVLDLAAAAGVDDVHLICALALHRRMTEAELRHAIGDRVYDAFEPRGMLSQHDAEDPDNLVYLGTTEHGEEVEINKRAATSDLLVYVNINLVAMDGGWKSTATGLASYRSLRHHHNPTTMEASHSFMDQPPERAAQEQLADGQGARRHGREGVPDRDDAEHRHVPDAVRVPHQAGVGVDRRRTGRPISGPRSRWRCTDPPGPQDPPLDRGAAPDDQRARPARSGPCTAARPSGSMRQHLVEVQGQTDILTMGIPYICPYNVNSIMNPILVMCMGSATCSTCTAASRWCARAAW